MFKLSGRARKISVLLFWLLLWHSLSLAMHNSILLVGPIDTLKALKGLAALPSFWAAVLTSVWHIMLGFLAAFLSGLITGTLACCLPFVGELLAPAIQLMKSIPVASFIILALIWTGSEDLAVLTSYLVVFPMLYVQTIAGLKSTDRKLLEMAAVFQIRGWPKLIGLYWPALLPYLMSGCRTALGMSWKAGIAAEVIGVPSHTIGEQLYLSKVYLSTAELFAWTFTIILISLLSERVFLLLLERTGRRPLLPKGRHDRHSRVSVQGNGHSWLSAQDLDKSFGDLQVLRKVCFHASAGVPCCIMGPSGSGKTTFFRVLLGLEQPDAGSVALTVPSSAPSSPFSVSAVFQEDRLCEGFSPIDNIRLAVPGLSTASIRRELAKILPEGCLTRPVATLSGGMKRRTAIARALLAPSDMIVMDEPFTGLDDETRQEVIRYVLEMSADRLLLISTHQREDVSLLGGELVCFP